MSRPSLPSTTIPCGGVNGHSPNRCDPTAFPKLAALFGFHSSGSGDGHRRRTGRRQRCSAIFSGSESSSSGPDSLTLPTDAVLLVPRVTSVTWHLQDRTVPRPHSAPRPFVPSDGGIKDQMRARGRKSTRLTTSNFRVLEVEDSFKTVSPNDDN